MGSSYYGEPSLGNGRAGGSNSRKGKKSNNSDKPKQPQRGLGVAQLEKIRLHNQMSCNYLPNSLHNPYHTTLNQEEEVTRLGNTYSSVPSSSSFSCYSSSSAVPFGFHPNIMMGMGEMEATDFRYGDSQSNITTRWNNNSGGISETQYSMNPTETRHLLGLNVKDSVEKKRIRKDRCDSIGSSSQYSDSCDVGELDLELKL
ncbi:protein SPEAR3-like [Telopea speciosissima]|uniref:protein SPEAR3-like n=1 Tax=Telopea speciosissima TaxID=54955 RepID=UPI001CC7E099|nr:protein SPEAR3-like [Telopea speciosissima]